MRTTVQYAIVMLLITQGVAEAAHLAGSEWRPVEIGGAEVPADTGIFVRFGGEGELTGHGGCNSFFGSYSITGDRIEIGPLGVTRMACPEPVSTREFEFLASLENAKQFARERIDLELRDQSGITLVRLIQTDAD